MSVPKYIFQTMEQTSSPSLKFSIDSILHDSCTDQTSDGTASPVCSSPQPCSPVSPHFGTAERERSNMQGNHYYPFLLQLALQSSCYPTIYNPTYTAAIGSNRCSFPPVFNSYVHPPVSMRLTTSTSSDNEDTEEEEEEEEGRRAKDTHLSPKNAKLFKKKKRTVFTSAQLQELESKFSEQKYLTKLDRCTLAKSLGLTEKHIKTWYQNRRTKWKRDCTEQDWSKQKEHAATLMYSQYLQMKSVKMHPLQQCSAY